MAISELDSFVEKFKQLSLAGITAFLNFDTNKRNTTVCLKAEIGLLTPTRGFIRKPRTPAYNQRSFYKQEVKNEREPLLPTDAEQASSTKKKMVAKDVNPEGNGNTGVNVE